MPLSQTLDSVASARKRRNLHPRACECECECDCDSIRVCKRQKKIENLVYKGLRSRGRCNPELDLSGDKGEKEGEKEDHSKICSAQGQRRSLRIRENFRRHGHLEINKDCHTQREKKEGLKVDKRGSKGEKKEGVKAVKKEESKAGKKEGLKAEHRSTRASYNGVDTKHVESWNYRLRCRVRNGNVESTNLQAQELKKEENNAELPRENQGVRTRGKRRREQELDVSDGTNLYSKEQETETKTSTILSWARKSKRTPRSLMICETENENKVVIASAALPTSNILRPDLTSEDADENASSSTQEAVADESKGGENQEPDSQERIDNEDVVGSSSSESIDASDGENQESGSHKVTGSKDNRCSSSSESVDALDGGDSDNKPDSTNPSMRNTVVPDILEVENDAICHDSKFHLEVMLVENAVHEPKDEIPSPEHGLKTVTSQCTGTVVSQNHMNHGEGMVHNKEISDSEDSSRDLGGQTKLQNAAGSSMLVPKSTNVIAHAHGIVSKVATANVDEMSKHADNTDPFEHSDRHQENAQPNAAKDVTEPGDRHGQDAQTDVVEDITQSNDKHLEMPLQEGAQETTEIDKCDLNVKVKHDSDESSGKQNHAMSFKFDNRVITEGRKCGLCGVGNDGKPPKKLFRDTTDSDNEMSGELQATTEETKYQDWDGFGDEAGWLGHLLGPLSDRFGIAGVWVHRQCAVWSPEVYFSGVGCLKNVRAALSRGRSLKCSRCGRPGATIGCRVDRCPRTYHLACGRAEGCVFDHRKYLMACTDHLHMFRPRGGRSRHDMQKMRFRRMVMERRKASTSALRKDLEAEEKCLENCGEDEEFLRRERKRLHRDLSRIAPVYIGGSSSGSAKFTEGWDSVAGLQKVIQCMKEVVILPLLYPECFERLGITPPRGVLLHGYPGTGKTLVVRALVGACAQGDTRIAYFARKGADCLGKYVGDAERQLRLLFQVAEQCQPSVIFFDEIDGLAPKRSRQQDQTHSSVVSTLLALMDGLKSRGSVVVIGATNRPGDLDPALRRPGRFDREIYFPLPSVKDRAAILGVHTRKWPKPASGDILSSVAKQTPGYAGADLQALCTQAAMIALKRKFPLQELLCSAERNSEDNQLPSIPPFTVKESDWATAIAQAPPPCSRRAGSMVINDVIAVPLQRHMVPALLQPLVELLFSLYLDGRIVLPPILSKAAMLIQSIIRSTLEEKCLLTTPCCSSLCSMLSGSSVAKDIERSLSAVGLIYDGIESLSSDCLVSSPCEDITGDVEDSDVKSDEAYSENMEKLKSWRTKGKGVGFRVLIAGDPKVGQKYLASCILHGFEGNVEIRKLNLSTMSQEGHGDIIQGLTHILGNCLSIGPCVIFMPRIESWALEKMTCESFDHDDERSSVPGQDILQEQTDVVEGDGVNGHSVASQAWNVLVQQVDTITSDVPLVLLATCGLPGVFLPLQIRNFFGIEALNASSSSITSKQTIPCFTVQLPTTFDCKLLFDQSAKSLTRVLIRRYIQFIHEVSHGDCIALRKSATSSSHGKMDARQGKNKIECHSQACTDRVDASLDDKKKTCNEDTVSVSLNGSHSVASQHQNLEDGYDQKEHGPNQMSHRSSYQGAGKGKTALQLAIATCGYQLLRYPQFAELCWVTSKLDEGPCTTIDGPWKGWPFNSCIVNESRSQQEVPSGDSSSEHKDTESSSVVRGLVAVGLLAYKGLYNTGKEVACEVRRVLELLIRRVKTKIQSGKDRYQFFPLLAQAASLEDMVNSWAYAIKSLEANLCDSGPDVPPCIDAKSELKCRALNDINVVEYGEANIQVALNALPVSNSDCKKVVPGECMSPMVKPGSFGPVISVTGTVLPSPSTPGSNNATFLEDWKFHPQVVSPVPNPEDMGCQHPISGGAVVQHNMDTSETKESHDPKATCGKPVNVAEPVNGMIPNAVCYDESGFQTNAKCLESISMNRHFHDGKKCPQFFSTLADRNGGDIDPTGKIVDSNNLSNFHMQCVYHCCAECIHTVHLMVKQFLINCWKAEGCCSSLEDIHDLVASCTVHVLAVMAQLGGSDTDEVKDLSGKQESMLLFDKKSCSCQDTCHARPMGISRRETGDNQMMGMPSRREANLGTMERMLRECKCHASPRRKNARRRHGPDASWLETTLNFVFTDNVCNSILKSLDGAQDLQFHCQTEHVCFCSLIQRLSTIQQPLRLLHL
eukprot:Gb_11471 [translate_table: standard]